MRLTAKEARKLGIKGKFPLVKQRKRYEFFPAQCREHGLPIPLAEFRFHLLRKWKLDFAWPAKKVALEIDGGVWTGGRHTRGKGFIGDMEKLNEAAIYGWRVLRCVPKDVESGAVFALLERIFK